MPTPYEWWTQKCAEVDEAEKELRAALAPVIQKMQIGSSGDPSMEELMRLTDARAQRDAIDKEMKEFIEKQFGP